MEVKSPGRSGLPGKWKALPWNKYPVDLGSSDITCYGWNGISLAALPSATTFLGLILALFRGTGLHRDTKGLSLDRAESESAWVWVELISRVFCVIAPQYHPLWATHLW